jgi:hypothetical protein
VLSFSSGCLFHDGHFGVVESCSTGCLSLTHTLTLPFHTRTFFLLGTLERVWERTEREMTKGIQGGPRRFTELKLNWGWDVRRNQVDDRFWCGEFRQMGNFHMALCHRLSF